MFGILDVCNYVMIWDWKYLSEGVNRTCAVVDEYVSSIFWQEIIQLVPLKKNIFECIKLDYATCLRFRNKFFNIIWDENFSMCIPNELNTQPKFRHTKRPCLQKENSPTFKRCHSQRPCYLVGGGFKHFWFSPLLVEMIQFDYCDIFQMGWNHQLTRLFWSSWTVRFGTDFMLMILSFEHHSTCKLLPPIWCFISFSVGSIYPPPGCQW